MQESKFTFPSPMRTRSRRSIIAATFIALFFVFHAELNGETRPFDFRNFTNLPPKGAFAIYRDRNEQIGEGYVVRLDRDELKLTFSLRETGIDHPTTLHLIFESERKSTLFFRLNLESRLEQIDSVRNERVSVPLFLIENGFLSFHYDRQKRFFQLSLDNHDTTILVINEGRFFLRAAEAPGRDK